MRITPIIIYLSIVVFPGAAAPAPACLEFNKSIQDQVSGGRLQDAKTALSEMLTGTAHVLPQSCEWILLQDMAVVMSRFGRLEDSERYAARSLRILEQSYPPDDPVLLGPLQMLSSFRIQLGKVAAARDAFQRMRQIRIDLPIDRALVHSTAATLLQAEGRPREAEEEYVDALAAWQESGHGGTADMAVVLNGLADLYIADGRFHEAADALDRALRIFAAAKDFGQAEQIRILNSRAVLSARLGHWSQAENEFRCVISLVRGEADMNPELLEPVLDNYARILRHNHHAGEAAAIEERLAVLNASSARRAVVDASDFLAK